MNISIDYEQGGFIRDAAAARIKSARMTLTPEYRREHLGWMTDAAYEQNCIDRENEITMLRELIDNLCEYCAYKRDGKDTDGTVWHRCTVHDELAPSSDAPCAGYISEPYLGETS